MFLDQEQLGIRTVLGTNGDLVAQAAIYTPNKADGTWNRDSSNQVAADLRLRPHDQRDQLFIILENINRET